jgi:hypothetical protein
MTLNQSFFNTFNMKQEDLEGSYHKNHTVEVEIDGEKQPVAILYLDNLKKSLGKRVTVSKKESDKAANYIKANKGAAEEVEKIAQAADRNAVKAQTKKDAKK